MAVAVTLAAWVNVAVPATAEEEGTWPSIRDAPFEGRELKDGTGLIALEAP